MSPIARVDSIRPGLFQAPNRRQHVSRRRDGRSKCLPTEPGCTQPNPTLASWRVFRLEIVPVSLITAPSSAKSAATSAPLESLTEIEFKRFAHHFFVLLALFIG